MGSVLQNSAGYILWAASKASFARQTALRRFRTMGLTNPVATREEQRRMPASKTTTVKPSGASRAAALPAIPNPTMATRFILPAR